MTDLSQHQDLPVRRIVSTWWPLAASWLLMGAELPLLSAIVARLPNPEINLAAYGGVVFPLALIIEAPIIMLLAASTALSKDMASYRLVYRFMMVAGAILTAIHILVAFTPLYYWVAGSVLSVPDVIIEPARIGLMIMTPWTWAIAYRRFNQGVLIRFGYSQTITIGTIIRMSADAIVLFAGYSTGSIQGIVVATSAVAAGVICEAVYSGVVIQPVLHNELKLAHPITPPLTWAAFYAFYIPLAMTSLLTLLSNPLGSAAISRMPDALSSLAVWPVMMGLIFMFRSGGIAYNEVVVALLDEPNSFNNLRRFTYLLAGITGLALLVLAITPLAELWFEYISALPVALVQIAITGLWFSLPLPALSVFQSWYQGAILHGRKTRGITEAVGVYLVTITLCLYAGVVWGSTIGLYVGVAALTVSTLTQTAWLWYRSLPVLSQVKQRDAHPSLDLAN